MKHAAVLVLAASVLCAGAYTVSRHYYRNVSPSLPIEGYWIWGMPGRVGEAALGCLDARQRRAAEALSNELVPSAGCAGAPGLLKIVVGLPGDRVHVDARGVLIGGKLLAHSAPMSGVTPAHDEVIPPGRAWLWSPITASLDSRYLGSVRVIGAARPEQGFTVADAARLRPRWVQ